MFVRAGMQVQWEVYSYELAGAASLPAAVADPLLMFTTTLTDDATASQRPVSDRSRPGTTTLVYRFDGTAGQ